MSNQKYCSYCGWAIHNDKPCPQCGAPNYAERQTKALESIAESLEILANANILGAQEGIAWEPEEYRIGMTD